MNTITYNQLKEFYDYISKNPDLTKGTSFPFVPLKTIVDRASPSKDIVIARNEFGTLGMKYVDKSNLTSYISYLNNDFEVLFNDYFYFNNDIELAMSHLRFKNMFNVFEELVRAKQYNKINYTAWKILRKVYTEGLFNSTVYLTITEDCVKGRWTEANSYNPCGFRINKEDISEFIRFLKDNDALKVNNKPVEERKDEEKMDIMKKFDFGTCEGDNVRFSPYGIAVKNMEGTWVAYNKSTNEIIDVDIFNFEGGKYFFKMPVAVSQVAVGDVIIHQRKPMIVVSIPNDKERGLYAVDPVEGERKNIMLTKSVFGFDFITKVISLLDFTNSATEEAPFGNMFPFFLLQDGEFDPMMLLLMNNNTDLMKNPLMLYALAGKGKSNDALPFLLMANNGNFKF